MSGFGHQVGGLRQIKINQLSTVTADCVIVAFSNSIVTAGAISETYLAQQSFVAQIAEGVVNGGVADGRKVFARRLKDVSGSWVVVPLPHRPQHRLPLRRQSRRLPLCG